MTFEDVYFPMRSNINFFEKKSNQPSLISRIKQSILLYENLYFDVGAYSLSCSDHISFDAFTPPEGINNLNLDVPEIAPKEFWLDINIEPHGRPVRLTSNGEMGNSYGVCFQKLLDDLGILEEEFIQLGTHILTPSGKKRLEKFISVSDDYKEYINVPEKCKETLLKNFYLSLLNSETIQTPIMVDNLHNQIIQKFNNDSIKKDKRLEVLNNILNTAENHLNGIEIPDFSLLDIDTIIDYKKDKLFKNFRGKIIEINKAVAEKNTEELNNIVMGEVIMELNDQLQELAPSRPKILIKIFTGIFGIFPGASELISAGTLAHDTIEGATSLHRYENSWLAFILTYQR